MNKTLSAQGLCMKCRKSKLIQFLIYHHHHLFALSTIQIKIFYNSKIYRRREDPGSRQVCGGCLTYILYQKTNKCCRNVRLGHLSGYFSKSSCIFVLKLRRFDERVTETGKNLESLVENSKLLVYDTNAFNNECLFWYYKNSRLH